MGQTESHSDYDSSGDEVQVPSVLNWQAGSNQNSEKMKSMSSSSSFENLAAESSGSDGARLAGDGPSNLKGKTFHLDF